MVLLLKVTKAICLPLTVLILLMVFQQSPEIVGASPPQPAAAPSPTTIAEWLASERLLHFESLSTKQGLSQTTVLCALQDRQGFMWFGTQDGLNRFDGYEFRVYRHFETEPGSLRDNYILSLYEDRAGTLWVGTNKGGLNRYDPQSETFTAFVHHPDDPESLSLNAVNAIVEDSNGYLWVATDGQGLNRFDKTTGKFKRFVNDPAIYENRRANIVNALFLDRSDALWLGTSWGLQKFDVKTNQIVARYSHDPNDPNSLRHNRVQTICAEPGGALWIGTTGGLHRLEAGRLTPFLHDPAKADSLASNDVKVALLDQRGQLWLGTSVGLERYDATAKRFVHQVGGDEKSQNADSNPIHALYEDRSGSLWFGPQDEGLKRYDAQAKPFFNFTHDPLNPQSLSHNIVSALLEDRLGDLLVSTQTGINQFDARLGQFRPLPLLVPHAPKPAPLKAMAFAEDAAGQVWAATNIGLTRLERLPNRELRARHFPINRGGSAVSATRDGAIWLGTHGGGLWRFDPATEQFTTFVHEPQNPHSLSDNLIYALCEDRTGFLWVGTDQGLNRLDRATGQFTRFLNDPSNPASLSYNLIWTLHEDRAGRLWIGTGNGLNRFDPATQQFHRITEKDGLASANIIGVLEDAQGQLWLGTMKGVTRFDPATKTIRHYDASDGLANNEVAQNAYYQNRAGVLFFGGAEGFSAFRPEQIQDDQTPPPIVLTACHRYNTDSAEGTALTEPGIAARSAIEFSYKDNILNFEFAALSFQHPEKNQYAYQLAGYSDRWIQLGTKHDVTFTNLDAGDYTLHVRGANADGVWNQTGVRLRLRIVPPFWRRWWFLSFELLAVVALAWGVYRWRITALQRRSAQQQEFARQLIESQEAERKRIAAELHDSLGQNLMVIKNRAALGEQVVQDPVLSKTQFDEITASVTQTISEVRAISQNLRPVNLDRLGLAAALEEMIERAAASSGVQISADIENLASGTLTKEQEINCFRIIQESFHNIVKHAQATKAYVELWREDDKLRGTVRDNGRGFVVEAARTGPTLGLTSIVERLRILGGTHSLKSAPGEGTTLDFSIPLADRENA